MTNRPPPMNVPSLILRNDENEQLFKLLGKGCLSLSTGVVQVLLAQPNPQKWAKKCTGVACFIKDNSKRSYYIRVYDLRFGQLTWEQELYTQFKYITPLPYFHTFSTDNCQAGLNFADEQEAARFAKAVQGKLRERQNRRTEKRRQNQSVTATIPTAPTTTGIPQFESKTTSVKAKEKKSKKKQKLTKADIGLPSDFQHIAHVGWDPDKGFDMNNLDPNLKALFQKIGVSEEKLKDEDTRNFIYSFIAKQGGMEAVKREVSTVKPARPPARPQPPPPVPSRDPPASSRDAAPPPPPPPARNNDRGFPPPPSVSKGHAPAGPRAPPPPPPSRDTTRASTKMPQPPRPPQKTAGNAPPPPPPPPPPGPLSGGPSSPSLPQKTGPPLPEVSDSRSALLSQIQGFKGAGTLKHVSEDKRSVGGDDRGTLMDEIRRGAKLHPASDRPDAPAPHDEEPSDGLAGALLLALKQREKAIQNYESSSASEEDEDDEEDDWSD